MSELRSYPELVERLKAIAHYPVASLEELGSFAVEGREYPMFLLRLGNRALRKLSVLISAGIHGDEPAGVEAALQFAEITADNPLLLEHFSFDIFPCDNPYGWERNTRENSHGLDLNRQFKVREPAPEIDLIMKGLHGGCFDLVYEMHEDCDSPGFYLYEFGEDPRFFVGEAVIEEVQSLGYPINTSPIIEKRRARGGIIRLNIRNYRRTRLPKSFYAYRECGGQVLTLEPPSSVLPLEDRVKIELLGLRVSLELAKVRKDALLAAGR